jgi:hypothetical protein
VLLILRGGIDVGTAEFPSRQTDIFHTYIEENVEYRIKVKVMVLVRSLFFWQVRC